jgi:hypothetical protein
MTHNVSDSHRQQRSHVTYKGFSWPSITPAVNLTSRKSLYISNIQWNPNNDYLIALLCAVGRVAQVNKHHEFFYKSHQCPPCKGQINTWLYFQNLQPRTDVCGVLFVEMVYAVCCLYNWCVWFAVCRNGACGVLFVQLVCVVCCL